MPAIAGAPLGVLDLSPITAGSTAADALRRTVDLAQQAERLGYGRYWLADRKQFRASDRLAAPRLMAGVNVVTAETGDEAHCLFSSLQQVFIALRQGRPGPLPPPDEHFERRLAPHERTLLDSMLAASFVGEPDTVARGLEAFVRTTGVDELIVATQVFDHRARVRSYELLAERAGSE